MTPPNPAPATDYGESACRLCHCCLDAPDRHGEILGQWVARAEQAEARAAAMWNIVRDRHADEAKRLAHCNAISLTSCQCGYLQRMWTLASLTPKETAPTERMGLSENIIVTRGKR